jgi:hypothetical protein
LLTCEHISVSLQGRGHLQCIAHTAPTAGVRTQRRPVDIHDHLTTDL